MLTSTLDGSIYGKGVLIWGIVAVGTYALSQRGTLKVRMSWADAAMVGLATVVAFWAIEWIALCRKRRTEGFSGNLPVPITVAASGAQMLSGNPSAAPAPASAPAAGGVDIENHFARTTEGLFSGDIVQIMAPDATRAGQVGFLQRDQFQSELLIGPEAQMNLSKVRFVLPNHTTDRLQPLRYRQPLYWMHSAYASNRNFAQFYVKRSTTLVSHQTGDHYRTFMLINPSNPNDEGPVQTNQSVWILSLSSQGLPDAYLHVKDDRRIGFEEPVNKATAFQLRVRRPAEPGDRHLIVAQEEALFP